MGHIGQPAVVPHDRREAVVRALERLAPRLPDFEAEAILDRAISSSGLRAAAPETAAWLTLVAYARHVFTDYDDLLAENYDRDSARHFVLDDINAVLSDWGCRRMVSEELEETSHEPPTGRTL